MDLADDDKFLRQTSTKQERKTDVERNQFVAPFSRNKYWTVSMSNNFFARTKQRIIQRLEQKHHLINVRHILTHRSGCAS